MNIDWLFGVFGWASPIGLGLFLVCFGIFTYLVTKNSKKKDK